MLLLNILHFMKNYEYHVLIQLLQLQFYYKIILFISAFKIRKILNFFLMLLIFKLLYINKKIVLV